MSRKLKEKIWKLIMFGALMVIVMVLASIVSIVVWKGAQAMSLNMIFKTPEVGFYTGQGAGGIANAILGSLYLASISTFIATIISIPIALALQKEFSHKYLIAILGTTLDIGLSIPSIVYGAICFTIMVYMGWQTSLLGGVLTLSVVITPLMARAIAEVMRNVPLELKEASLALGATKSEMMLKIVLKQIFPGIITAIMLAFGRAIGDSAAVLFTAGYTDRLPSGLWDSVASLPLAIFFQLSQPFEAAQNQAYAAALILLIIVLTVSIGARLIANQLKKHTIQ